MNRKSLLISISLGLLLVAFVTVNTLVIQRVLAGEKELETVSVKKETFEDVNSFDGLLVPQDEEVYYYQRTRGEISEFLVGEGEEVSIGTALFEYESDQDIDVSELEAEQNKVETEIDVLDDQLNDLSSQASTIQLNSELNDEERIQLLLGIDEQIRETEYQKRLAELDAKELDRKIQAADQEEVEREIESSLEGTVTQLNRTPENGEAVAKVDSNELAVQGSVSELDYPLLAVDQEVTIKAPAYPGKSVSGRITMVENRPYSIEEESSYFHFTVLMDETEDMTAGTHVEIEVPLHQNVDAPIVPRESIINKDDVSYVVVVEKKKLKLRTIETGRVKDNAVEVLTGLKVNEKVLKRPREEFTELLTEKKQSDEEAKE
ncbi:efflux RND transporter periplasmic adaptor subunit [Guptibacillus algicola]|uniref:efflux RND transporter periplasmic adaptor subunit n=1 Tax=Guptibacillus algicola TaxID=225844 RepID=UPI001CD5F8E3|nr:HlyD family efflux transporter periplasmic adaptor subunit [Alkalihalobacillus algicola]MCA0987746.1 HlyD family efflux transporter periplasmic adaptor subunit [Alkalihalobacillus algicola]